MLLYTTLIDEPRHKSIFESIYYTYRASMHKIAFSILNDHHWAEDAVSEDFLKIAKNIKTISELSEQDRKGYFVVIIRNSALDIYRKRLVQETPIDFAEELGDTQSDFDLEEKLLQEDGYAHLLQAIQRLDPTYRDAMILHYIYGHSATEVGDLLGVKENTIHARLSRGRRKLKEILREEGTGR